MKTLGLLAMLALVACAHGTETLDTTSVVQTAVLDASHPYFIPTHPRVTTTIRFPGEIGAPDGSIGVFTEDASKQPGEYLVTWQQGDPYFTLTPLKEAAMANLNIPYQGQTYVFFLYQVTDPLKAVASVNLTAGSRRVPVSAPAPAAGVSAPPPPVGAVSRRSSAPQTAFVPATTARLLGFLDRLKLIHATPFGASLASMAAAMDVQIAVRRTEFAPLGAEPAGELGDRIGEISSGCNDAGLYQIVLLRAVRDRRLNAIGFICLLRNTSDQVLTFDVSSFGARAGASYLGQRISDAPATVGPGAQAPAYFVVLPDRNAPLLATNEWRLSVDLVSPRPNPGAVIASRFGQQSSAP